MKKFIWWLVIALLISCSKKEEKFYDFEFVEFKTGVPVGQAMLTLFKCTQHDILYGCQQTGVIATHTTGPDGKVRVSETQYHTATQGATISKMGFWTHPVTTGRNEISREGFILLQVIKTNNYPSGAWLNVYCRDERSFLDKLTFHMAQPGDTSVTIKGFAGQVNTIRWAVSSDPMGFLYHATGTFPLSVPASGTVPAVLNF